MALSVNAHRKLNRFLAGFRDCVLWSLGKRCVRLGAWPEEGLVKTAVDGIRDLGGEKLEKDIGFGFDDAFYFRVRGRNVRLIIAEYGHVNLIGSRKIVMEISREVAKKLPLPRT